MDAASLKEPIVQHYPWFLTILAILNSPKWEELVEQGRVRKECIFFIEDVETQIYRRLLVIYNADGSLAQSRLTIYFWSFYKIM